MLFDPIEQLQCWSASWAEASAAWLGCGARYRSLRRWGECRRGDVVRSVSFGGWVNWFSLGFRLVRFFPFGVVGFVWFLVLGFGLLDDLLNGWGGCRVWR